MAPHLTRFSACWAVPGPGVAAGRPRGGLDGRRLAGVARRGVPDPSSLTASTTSMLRTVLTSGMSCRAQLPRLLPCIHRDVDECACRHGSMSFLPRCRSIRFISRSPERERRPAFWRMRLRPEHRQWLGRLVHSLRCRPGGTKPAGRLSPITHQLRWDSSLGNSRRMPATTATPAAR